MDNVYLKKTPHFLGVFLVFADVYLIFSSFAYVIFSSLCDKIVTSTIYVVGYHNLHSGFIPK